MRRVCKGMDALPEPFANAARLEGGDPSFRPWVTILLQVVVLAAAFVGAVALMFARRHRALAVVTGVAVALAAAALAARRETFLPFLGAAALPPSLLKDGPVAPRDANVETSVLVDAPDGTRVLYWGAQPAEAVVDAPAPAYANYENAGVAVVKSGRATLRLACPASYRVPWRGALDRHVHYRVAAGAVLGPVHSAHVEC